MSKTACERILIVNDDDKWETFLVKYGIEGELKEEIVYCESIAEALECVMDQEKFYCDKILLDIKMQWSGEGRYDEEIRKYIDLEMMKREHEKYGGFILFMYLLARGFPIDRIAFLSAYIMPDDSKEKQKQAILKFIKNEGQRRTKATDTKIIEMSRKIPLLEKHIEMLFSQFPQKGRKVYEEIQRVLEEDLGRGDGQPIADKEPITDRNTTEPDMTEKNSQDKAAAGDFLEKIAKVGLNIKKIAKESGGKGNRDLKQWFDGLDEPQINRYYKFRATALNICDRMIVYYAGLEQEIAEKETYNLVKTKGIYRYTKQVRDVLEKYPPRYFVGMLENVKNALVINADEKKLSEICNHVVDNLIGYWEAFMACYSEEREEWQKSSATMVMKFTRNWKMHNLIKKDIDIHFMCFVFLVSVRLMMEENEELKFLEKRIIQCFDLEQVSKKQTVSAKEVFIELNEKLNKKPYEINLYRLFDAYGKNDSSKQKITKKDIYKIFYMTLHCPRIEVSSDDSELKLVFCSEGGWEKDWLWKELESIASFQIQDK